MTVRPTPAAAPCRVAIGLGSNVGDRAAHLQYALDELARRGAVRWTAVSAWYETDPVGPVADQPPFLNGAATGETFLTPQALLSVCNEIEAERGRVREVRWGPRTLDLDILLWDDETIDTPTLTVPHPELARRAFVLMPLAEIAPGWVVPGTVGQTVAYLLANVEGREGVRRWRFSATKQPI